MQLQQPLVQLQLEGHHQQQLEGQQQQHLEGLLLMLMLGMEMAGSPWHLMHLVMAMMTMKRRRPSPPRRRPRRPPRSEGLLLN